MRTITENGQSYLVSEKYPDAPCVKVLRDGWQEVDGKWIAPDVPTPRQAMSKYAFLNGRMTQAERIALAQLRDTNAAAGAGKNYELADFFELFALAEDIRTDDLNTVAGITAIGTALGWTAERIAEILA
jgi:predicted metalloendopeptidase